MRALTAYRGVLAVREARALIGASAASQIGDWLYNAALLGYVFSATHSAAWVGAATIGRLLPYVLLGPFGGAVADRYPRRTVLLEAAPTLTPALNRTSTAPGVDVPPDEPKLIDDPRWVERPASRR